MLTLYGRHVGKTVARPKELAGRLERLLTFWGNKTLADINGSSCRLYVEHRGTSAAARRELEDLRAAVYLHRKEGLCSEVVEVAVPPKPPPRERWLSRSEAAKLLWAAWSYREQQNFRGTDRRTRRHIARFILVALYTGTRASAICGASFRQQPGHGWVDLDTGVFHRRASGAKRTKKRQPAIPLPDELLAHMRRWRARGQEYVIEWNGGPVDRIYRAFTRVAKDAGLGPDVTPHVLRHTAVTWSMQAGTDPWEAAGYYGLTLETLREHYGHHHPAHMNSARTAFRRLRRSPTKKPAKKTPEGGVNGG